MTEEETKLHVFKVPFTDAEWARLEAYVRRTGMKKFAAMRKAILAYLAANET